MMVNNLIKAGNQLLFIYLFLIENEDLSSQSKPTQNQGKHQIWCLSWLPALFFTEINLSLSVFEIFML